MGNRRATWQVRTKKECHMVVATVRTDSRAKRSYRPTRGKRREFESRAHTDTRSPLILRSGVTISRVAEVELMTIWPALTRFTSPPARFILLSLYYCPCATDSWRFVVTWLSSSPPLLLRSESYLLALHGQHGIRV